MSAWKLIFALQSVLLQTDDKISLNGLQKTKIMETKINPAIPEPYSSWRRMYATQIKKAHYLFNPYWPE
jgi:hypothetical protein